MKLTRKRKWTFSEAQLRAGFCMCFCVWCYRRLLRQALYFFRWWNGGLERLNKGNHYDKVRLWNWYLSFYPLDPQTCSLPSVTFCPSACPGPVFFLCFSPGREYVEENFSLQLRLLQLRVYIFLSSHPKPFPIIWIIRLFRTSEPLLYCFLHYNDFLFLLPAEWAAHSSESGSNASFFKELMYLTFAHRPRWDQDLNLTAVRVYLGSHYHTLF